MLLRILRFPLTLLVLGFVLFAACYVLTGVAVSMAPWLNTGPSRAGFALMSVIVATFVWRLFQRWVEGRGDAELAAPGAEREVALGLGIGFVLFSAVVGVTMLLGGMSIQGVRGMGNLWAMLAMAIASGFYEEVLFRGILFRQIEAMLGSWAALVLTSAFFGLAHIVNPGATWFSSFAIAMEAGILLGAAYMLTRRLWLAMGLHAAWNFTQGWVFSAPVSGGKAPEGLLITARSGPDWLTGGAFGLEASVIALVMATSLGLVLLRRAIGQGQLQAPMWARKTVPQAIQE